MFVDQAKIYLKAGSGGSLGDLGRLGLFRGLDQVLAGLLRLFEQRAHGFAHDVVARVRGQEGVEEVVEAVWVQVERFAVGDVASEFGRSTRYRREPNPPEHGQEVPNVEQVSHDGLRDQH